jgi:hypothetical protein
MDNVLRMMARKHIPLTRDNYIFFAYLGEKEYEDLEGEELGMLPDTAGEKPRMWGPSIIGFGSYHYKYESGREGDMPLIAFSPRKAATVLCGMTGFSEVATLLAKLGKHSTGKGCLYIKKLADVDQHVLEAMMVKSLAAKRIAAPQAKE